MLSGSSAWQMALPDRPFATQILLNRKKAPIYKYRILVPKKPVWEQCLASEASMENDK